MSGCSTGYLSINGRNEKLRKICKKFWLWLQYPALCRSMLKSAIIQFFQKSYIFLTFLLCIAITVLESMLAISNSASNVFGCVRLTLFRLFRNKNKKFQNFLLIRRTIKYVVKSNDWYERYNSDVFFFYRGRNCGQRDWTKFLFCIFLFRNRVNQTRP